MTDEWNDNGSPIEDLKKGFKLLSQSYGDGIEEPVVGLTGTWYWNPDLHKYERIGRGRLKR